MTSSNLLNINPLQTEFDSLRLHHVQFTRTLKIVMILRLLFLGAPNLPLILKVQVRDSVPSSQPFDMKPTPEFA